MLGQVSADTRERPAWLPYDEFPFESRFLDLEGHQIHYMDEGRGPALLFVHAGPAWSFVYRDLIVRLRNEFRCVALDLPASGLSVAAEGYRPGLEPATRVLEAFVLALDLRDVTLVVHDLGGPVSFHVAATHAGRFRALAITESFGWPLSQEHPKVARLLRLVGGRAFEAVNDATNLLIRLTSTSAGAGRHLSRAGRRAFRGPHHIGASGGRLPHCCEKRRRPMPSRPAERAPSPAGAAGVRKQEPDGARGLSGEMEGAVPERSPGDRRGRPSLPDV